MHKIIISGGPSTGKSTTFEMLKEEFPEAHFIPEAAEIVIKRELEKGANNPDYKPIMPTENYLPFAKLNLAQHIDHINSIPNDDEYELCFFDRSILDDKAFAAYNRYEKYVPELEARFKSIGFSVVFFCDSLSIFEQTEIRRESPEAGLEIHEGLREVYAEANLPMITLPPVSKEKRIEIIRRTVSEL